MVQAAIKKLWASRGERPVILSSEAFEEWLDPTNEDTASLQRFLVSYDPALMDAYAVGPVQGEGRGLIVPTD